MKRIICSLISALLLVLVITILSVIGRMRVEIIARQKAKTNSELLTTRDAFVRSLISARVPGGVVRTSNCGSEENRLQTEVLALPLSQSLNRITQTDPQYRWQSEQGVINLIPTAGENRSHN